MLEADALRAQARRQHQQVIEIGGRRGSIVDREGREFAVSITTQSLYAHPPRLRKDADRAARLLAPYLARPESELRALLGSDEPFVWLKRRLDPQTSRAIAKLDPKLIYKGGPIDFQEEPKRFYPAGRRSACTSSVSPTSIRRASRASSAPSTTRSRAIRRSTSRSRDARDTMILQPLRPPAKRSHDVVLTIDLVLQHVVERELDRAMDETGAKAASAILLDPKTGQILALANRPTVDPRSYGKGPADARRNRAIQDVLEPGSTFKVVSASAATRAGHGDSRAALQLHVVHRGRQVVYRRAQVRRVVRARDSRAFVERRNGPGRTHRSPGGPQGHDRALRLRSQDRDRAAGRAQRQHHVAREDVRDVARPPCRSDTRSK